MSETVPIPGTYVFDGARARAGYEISRLGMSLKDAANRQAFLDDEDAYLDRFALTAEQRAAIKARDWLALVQMGGNVFYVFKLTALCDQKMIDFCSAQTGLEPAELTKRLRGEED